MERAAFETACAQDDYVVLEKGPKAGMFFDVYPRHRQLISINKARLFCALSSTARR